MEMETNHDSSQTRKAAVGSLAIVGFIALILIGIATAIYAASFLPKAFSHLSTANVYLSTLTQPSGNDNQLQVVNSTSTPVTDTPAPTSIPLSPAATSTPVTPTTPATPAPKPAYTPPSYTPTYQVVTVPAQTYYGLPDLVTNITSVGYLRNSGDTSSFVSANTVPNGYQGAVRFVIANRGTNVSGGWTFLADLPTNDSSGNYRSSSQRSLNPGDSIVFTLGFDSTNRGSDSIRVEADSSDTVRESNESNNDDSASIYLNGSSTSGSGNYDSNGNYCSYGTYYQGGRTYCSGPYSNNSSGNYDSYGTYCPYGTYSQGGRTYCDSSTNYGSNDYDSSGNFCRYGSYYQGGRTYCN